MSVPVYGRKVTVNTTQARQGTPTPTEAQHDTPIVIGGEAYLSPGDALERLSDGVPTSAIGLYQKLRNAVLAGEVATVKIHPKMKLYRQADVLELRARLLARG